LQGKLRKLSLLILDNYDSFTWNLVHYVEPLCDNLTVRRNDEISLDEIADFERILLSPGPGLPKDAGIMPELIATYHRTHKILGICLGMQAIAEFYGAQLYNLNEVKHGISTTGIVLDRNERLFANLSPSFEIGHYHSWAVQKHSLPATLIATAENEDGILMGLRHENDQVKGLQFHPESVLTPHGLKMIENWMMI